jgi:FixJ family two-component response regulator
VRVILSSGYSEEDVAVSFPGKGLAGFVQKPYRASTLVEKVRQVLTGKGRA